MLVVVLVEQVLDENRQFVATEKPPACRKVHGRKTVGDVFAERRIDPMLALHEAQRRVEPHPPIEPVVPEPEPALQRRNLGQRCVVLLVLAAHVRERPVQAQVVAQRVTRVQVHSE